VNTRALLRKTALRIGAPYYVEHYVALTIIGFLIVAALSGLVRLTGAQLPEEGAISAVALFSGLLPVVLILSSVYWAVVGMMFPEYSKATPVFAIQHSPFVPLLDVLTLALGYGAGIWVIQILSRPTGWSSPASSS
jgi:hypothetical protein